MVKTPQRVVVVAKVTADISRQGHYLNDGATSISPRV